MQMWFLLAFLLFFYFTLMRRVQIVTTVVVVTLLLISTFFVYRKQEPVFETKPGQEIESDETKVIMSVMGNQTEK